MFADTIDGAYRLHAYSETGSLHTGYNSIFFTVTKLKNSNYVKDIEITDITPLMSMQMGEMTMKHSTPVGGDADPLADKPEALKGTWVSFLMPSADMDYWTISYKLNILGQGAKTYEKEINVSPLPDGQAWLKTFKTADETYILSLVEPDQWKTGTNEIKAYISRKASPITSPYPLSDREFIVEHTPTMPDMGNHTSPDNTPLTLKDDGSYSGNINITMTGLWRVHLTVRDALTGEIVAGGDDTSDGFSSLFWDITL